MLSENPNLDSTPSVAGPICYSSLLLPLSSHLSQVTFFCKANLVPSSCKSKIIEVHKQHVYLSFLSASSLYVLQKTSKMSTREPLVPPPLLNYPSVSLVTQFSWYQKQHFGLESFSILLWQGLGLTSQTS